MKTKIAVIGASGFVGSSFVEYAQSIDELEITPFIHRAGSAARLARSGIELKTLDVLDKQAVAKALASFDAVVNCSRGGSQVMLYGLDNILHACQQGQPKRFVHISSVAVYGDPPNPESVDELAPANPLPGSYGDIKLKQDQKVRKAAAQGLRSVVLCPPNITGPYSGYVTDVLSSIEAGTFRLLDGGRYEVNTIDVRNLAEAILCALRTDSISGERYFICEDEPFTWADLCRELAPLCRKGIPVPAMPVEEFELLVQPGVATANGRSASALKHLVSDEVRAALRQNQRLAGLEKAFRHGIALMGKPIETRLQRAVVGPIRVPKVAPAPALGVALISQQLRKVKHSSARARSNLGYTQKYSVRQSFEDFRSWYECFLDAGSSEWSLLVPR